MNWLHDSPILWWAVNIISHWLVNPVTLKIEWALTTFNGSTKKHNHHLARRPTAEFAQTLVMWVAFYMLNWILFSFLSKLGTWQQYSLWSSAMVIVIVRPLEPCINLIQRLCIIIVTHNVKNLKGELSRPNHFKILPSI